MLLAISTINSICIHWEFWEKVDLKILLHANKTVMHNESNLHEVFLIPTDCIAPVNTLVLWSDPRYYQPPIII